MGEQKNLFLAIGLSIAIIVIFQILFPQQPVIENNDNKNIPEETQSLTSIDGDQVITSKTIQTKDEVLILNKRISINTPSLKGSINLTGGILDDLILLKNNEKLNDNSKKITLFSPEGTANPYYIELGWKKLSNNTSKISLPTLDTKWKSTSSSLTPDNPVTLFWTNNENITFIKALTLNAFKHPKHNH